MILSAGLSPAWQQILVFDKLRWGEVNRAREAAWCGSGKVLNAGLAVHRLGGPSLTLAPLGGLPLGEIDREFAQLGVPRRWIETQAATRVCTTILDRATGRITELVENGRPLSESEYRAFLAAYAEEAARAEVVVLIGSLPGGAPDSLYRDLVACTHCPLVLDFRGEGLLSVLDLKPYVIKPNREELGQTVGRSLDDDADMLAAMRELNRLGAQWVVVTHGSHDVWVSSTEHAYRLVPPRIAEVVNPIGCGDCLAAGIAWATRRGDSIIDAVRFGIGRRAIIWESSCQAGWSGRKWQNWRARWRFSRNDAMSHESTARRATFDLFGFGGPAAGLADECGKFLLAVDRDSLPLVHLVEGIRRHRAKQGQLFVLLAGLLFKQAESGPHDLAGTGKPPRCHQFVDELVVVVGQINISRRHFCIPQDPTLLIAYQDLAKIANTPMCGRV